MKKTEKKDCKMTEKVKTLVDLKKSKYVSKTIKEEMISNLKVNLSKDIPSFEGIHGYEAVSYTHLTLPTKRIV